MHIVHVFVRVKTEFVEAFWAASLANAEKSIEEPGVSRFDVLQEQEDPTRFVLLEVYRTAQDPARHKETVHYALWRDTVAPMMAEPRRGVVYRSLYPDEAGW